MAMRLCWRKRRRMLQHFAAQPGPASTLPSSDLVHPLHRSVSHSCPAQYKAPPLRPMQYPAAYQRPHGGQYWNYKDVHVAPNSCAISSAEGLAS